MSAMTLRLPDYLHKQVRMLAEREMISINQLITLAIAEKVAVLMAEDQIRMRAENASREKFLAALSTVPDTEPEPEDRFE